MSLRTTLTSRRVLVAVAGAWLVLLGSTAGAVPAQAEPSPAPALSVTVDNGRSTVAPGDRLDYAITVKNLGDDAVRLRLSQTLPQGSTLVTSGSDGANGSDGPDGSVKAGTLRWTVDVPALGQVDVRSTLRVTDPAPPDLLRLATVACAATSAKGPPLVCATDSDLLPAGAAEQQRVAPAVPAPAPRSWWPYAGGSALLLGLVVSGWVLLRRQRRQAADPPVAQRAALPDLQRLGPR